MTASAKTNNNYVPSTKGTEEYMNDAQMKHFENKLKTHKTELKDLIDRGINSLRDNNEKVADEIDAAAQNEALILNLNQQDEAKRELSKVERSLRMIQEDDYGYCEGCGIEIGVKRMDARPTSIKCIDCASLEEQKNKNTHYRPAHMR